ncbi:polysaccharide biosynthesis protein [Microbacterium plantarum]|uniref:hypothetical protein n=1 Tax=Microbacterium plantarum TaxID=1816425 RepID=UPI002B4678A4|nr:hypothetical protein [Microbacterium plantarum]WRK16645.1 hypothetical protein VC184_12095 [Microbacterium plantarum]
MTSGPGSSRRRLLGFTVLPALAAVSPLVVLSVVSRAAGPAGWASALAGEAVGTFAAIALAFGWTTIGPALVATADDAHRGRLFREALVVRAMTAAVALPAAVVICVGIATDGFQLLTVLMGLQGALIAMSYTWFAVGLGDPLAIAIYDAVPRLLAAIMSAVAIGVWAAPIEIYPLAGIAVTVIGTTWYTVGVLRRFPARWPVSGDLPNLFRRSAPVAINEAALGLYSSTPVPLVNVATASTAAAGFATADKMVKLGQFLPVTLANALQFWTTEVRGAARARRLRIALTAHVLMGLLGWVVLAVAGHAVSALLFGEDAAAPTAIVIVLGFAFACYSTRTSLMRHFLFPVGATRTVMSGTLLGSAIGLPTMIALTLTIGPIGTAVGYALTEAIAMAWLFKSTRTSYRTLVAESPPGASESTGDRMDE